MAATNISAGERGTSSYRSDPLGNFLTVLPPFYLKSYLNDMKAVTGSKKPLYKNIWVYVITVSIIASVACLAKIRPASPNLLKSKNHYIAGFVYYNSKDQRIFIPRDDGLGWTLNFANGWSYTVVGMIVLVALYSVLRSLEKPK